MIGALCAAVVYAALIIAGVAAIGHALSLGAVCAAVVYAALIIGWAYGRRNG